MGKKNFTLKKEHYFLEGSQASPVCPSGKSNMYMKMRMENLLNGNERREPKYSENMSKCQFSITTPTWTELGSNPDLKVESRAIKLLSL
jgi:hypothetical protein